MRIKREITKRGADSESVQNREVNMWASLVAWCPGQLLSFDNVVCDIEISWLKYLVEPFCAISWNFPQQWTIFQNKRTKGKVDFELLHKENMCEGLDSEPLIMSAPGSFALACPDLTLCRLCCPLSLPAAPSNSLAPLGDACSQSGCAVEASTFLQAAETGCCAPVVCWEFASFWIENRVKIK